jgi:hypothetical protein
MCGDEAVVSFYATELIIMMSCLSHIKVINFVYKFRMNSSLHELQSDIQRLATQQHQIQDLTAHHHLQGLVSQQQHHIQVCVTFCVFVHEFRMGCGLGGLGFDIQSRQVIFLFTKASRPALLFAQPHIQCALGALSPG